MKIMEVRCFKCKTVLGETLATEINLKTQELCSGCRKERDEELERKAEEFASELDEDKFMNLLDTIKPLDRPLKELSQTRRNKIREKGCPEVRAYRAKYRIRPEVVAKRREYNATPKAKARRDEYYSRPEIKKRQSEYARRHNARPDIKARRSELDKIYRSIPEVRKRKARQRKESYLRCKAKKEAIVHEKRTKKD